MLRSATAAVVTAGHMSLRPLLASPTVQTAGTECKRLRRTHRGPRSRAMVN